MATAGIIIMVVMMGAMLLSGGHGMMGKMEHDQNKSASHEVTVSTPTAVSTSAVQSTPANDTRDAEHAH